MRVWEVKATRALVTEMDGGGSAVAPLGQQLIDAATQGTIERVGALLDRDSLHGKIVQIYVKVWLNKNV